MWRKSFCSKDDSSKIAGVIWTNSPRQMRRADDSWKSEYCEYIGMVANKLLVFGTCWCLEHDPWRTVMYKGIMMNKLLVCENLTEHCLFSFAHLKDVQKDTWIFLWSDRHKDRTAFWHWTCCYTLSDSGHAVTYSYTLSDSGHTLVFFRNSTDLLLFLFRPKITRRRFWYLTQQWTSSPTARISIIVWGRYDAKDITSIVSARAPMSKATQEQLVLPCMIPKFDYQGLVGTGHNRWVYPRQRCLVIPHSADYHAHREQSLIPLNVHAAAD